MVHELKTWPVWFEMVRSGRKTFELRVNDRNYQCGDTLLLREWDPKTEVYTGSEERRVVADIIDMSPLSECVSMVFMDDASAALRARVAQLEEAGAALVERWDTPNWKDAKHTGEYIAALRSALAATPAQSLARVKAAALREAAKEVRDMAVKVERSRTTPVTWEACEQRLLEMADRLEAEAANGTEEVDREASV